MRKELLTLCAICLAGFASSQTFQPCKWDREAKPGDLTEKQAIERFLQIFKALDLNLEGESLEFFATTYSMVPTFEARILVSGSEFKVDVFVDAKTGSLIHYRDGTDRVSYWVTPDRLERLQAATKSILAVGRFPVMVNTLNMTGALWNFYELRQWIPVEANSLSIITSPNGYIQFATYQSVTSKFEDGGSIKITEAQALAAIQKLDPKMKREHVKLWWSGSPIARRVYIGQRHDNDGYKKYKVDAETGEVAKIYGVHFPSEPIQRICLHPFLLGIEDRFHHLATPVWMARDSYLYQ